MNIKENDLLSKIESEIMRRHQNPLQASTLSPPWSGKKNEMFGNGPFSGKQ